MKNMVYKLIKNNIFTKSMVNVIEERMSIIYPGNKEKVVDVTLKEILKIIIINILVVSIILLYGKTNIFYVFMSFMIMYMLSKNKVYSKFNMLDIKLLKQFEKFLQDVRFKFKYDGMIDEALQEALQNSDYEMYLQGNLLLESLNDKESDSYTYVDIAPNSFFMTFYALCVTVKRYGDKIKNDKSLFIMNLSFLKDDINTEILKREKINAMFMGLTGIIVIPLFAIKSICIWGIRNIPQLTDYYNGVIGKLTIVIITVITLIIFNIVMKLKYPIDFDNNKSLWIKELLDIKWVDELIMQHISKNYKKYYRMDMFLKSIVYKYNVKEFLICRIFKSIGTFILSTVLIISMGIHKIGILGVGISILLIACVTICTYNYEYMMLLIREKLLKISREEEIVRFQSVILILMYMDRVSIEVILEWLERFAIVFKNNIERIADTLVYKGIKVFDDAKDDVAFLPFERLMDCFIASDRIGIEKSFSDILSDRAYYVEKHKQENDLIINNKALIAKFISFIPICIVICFVLVIPFVYQGLRQIQSFTLI